MFILFGVSKKVRYMRGGIEFFHQNFLSLCQKSSERKNFAGEPFCVSQKFWYRKSLWKRGREEGGSIMCFRQNFFVSVPKNFVGEPFSVSLISGIEKSYA